MLLAGVKTVFKLLLNFSHLESKEGKCNLEFLAVKFDLVLSGFLAVKFWLASLFKVWLLGDPPGVPGLLNVLDAVLTFSGVFNFSASCLNLLVFFSWLPDLPDPDSFLLVVFLIPKSDTVIISTPPPSILANSFHLCTLWLPLVLVLLLLWIILLVVFLAAELDNVIFSCWTCSVIELLLLTLVGVLLLPWWLVLVVEVAVVAQWPLSFFSGIHPLGVVCFGRWGTCSVIELLLLWLLGLLLLLW